MSDRNLRLTVIGPCEVHCDQRYRAICYWDKRCDSSCSSTAPQRPISS